MAYLNLDTNFFDHPKTRRLVGILGPMADVLPLRLWAYCAKIHPVDGVMKGYSEAEIEGVIHWIDGRVVGVEGQLSPTEALVKVGFLKKLSTGYACVDWKQHEGHLAAFSRRGKAAAEARWRKYASSNAQASTGNAPTGPSVPTNPNPSDPSGTGTGDGFAEHGQRTKAIIAEAAILMKPWHLKGQYQGVRINDLPADYCAYAIKNFTKLTPEERLGCEIIIKRKQDELHPQLRRA